MGKRRHKRDSTLAASLKSRIVKRVQKELKNESIKHFKMQKTYYLTMIVCVSLITFRFILFGGN